MGYDIYWDIYIYINIHSTPFLSLQTGLVRLKEIWKTETELSDLEGPDILCPAKPRNKKCHPHCPPALCQTRANWASSSPFRLHRTKDLTPLTPGRFCFHSTFPTTSPSPTLLQKGLLKLWRSLKVILKYKVKRMKQFIGNFNVG